MGLDRHWPGGCFNLRLLVLAQVARASTGRGLDEHGLDGAS